MTEFEKYQLSMAIRSRKIQMALAVLNRAKEADIPEKEMRITEKEFVELLDVPYFSLRNMSKPAVEKMCHEMFTIPEKLNVPFILIDGGSMYLRRRAGFALMFRMIAWDKTGKYYNCNNMAHLLQTWDSFQGQSRNDFAEELKNYDVLFIGECSMGLFKPTLEAGSFLDEIFDARESSGKTTIISFQQWISPQQIISPEVVQTSNSAG